MHAPLPVAAAVITCPVTHTPTARQFAPSHARSPQQPHGQRSENAAASHGEIRACRVTPRKWRHETASQSDTHKTPRHTRSSHVKVSHRVTTPSLNVTLTKRRVTQYLHIKVSQHVTSPRHKLSRTSASQRRQTSKNRIMSRHMRAHNTHGSGCRAAAAAAPTAADDGRCAET